MFRTTTLGAMAIAMALATTAARADEISDLNDMYETMVAVEAHLLDERAAAEQTLAMPDAILIENSDGSISALPRASMRDGIGMGFDIAQQIDLQEALRPFLPKETNSLINPALSSGIGRFETVNRQMDRMLAEQPRLREAQRQRISEIERLLDEVRTTAAAAIAERDARIAARDAAGVIDGSVCFDGSAADGEATVATIGYGGGRYPVHGAFICTMWNGFLWDSGATIREFRCTNRDARPPVCTLFSEMAYSVDHDPDTSHTIYRLEDQQTTISFHFK